MRICSHLSAQRTRHSPTANVTNECANKNVDEVELDY